LTSGARLDAGGLGGEEVTLRALLASEGQGLLLTGAFDMFIANLGDEMTRNGQVVDRGARTAGTALASALVALTSVVLVVSVGALGALFEGSTAQTAALLVTLHALVALFVSKLTFAATSGWHAIAVLINEEAFLTDGALILSAFQAAFLALLTGTLGAELEALLTGVLLASRSISTIAAAIVAFLAVGLASSVVASGAGLDTLSVGVKEGLLLVEETALGALVGTANKAVLELGGAFLAALLEGNLEAGGAGLALISLVAVGAAGHALLAGGLALEVGLSAGLGARAVQEDHAGGLGTLEAVSLSAVFATGDLVTGGALAVGGDLEAVSAFIALVGGFVAAHTVLGTGIASALAKVGVVTDHTLLDALLGLVEEVLTLTFLAHSVLAELTVIVATNAFALKEGVVLHATSALIFRGTIGAAFRAFHAFLGDLVAEHTLTTGLNTSGFPVHEVSQGALSAFLGVLAAFAISRTLHAALLGSHRVSISTLVASLRVGTLGTATNTLQTVELLVESVTLTARSNAFASLQEELASAVETFIISTVFTIVLALLTLSRLHLEASLAATAFRSGATLGTAS